MFPQKSLPRSLIQILDKLPSQIRKLATSPSLLLQPELSTLIIYAEVTYKDALKLRHLTLIVGDQKKGFHMPRDLIQPHWIKLFH
jgi:hypothetical protein